MAYRIIVPKRVHKELFALHSSIERRITDAIDALGQDPRPNGCRKMKGFRDRYRIRIGDYRVIYDIHDNELIILIVDVNHRKDVYRKK